MLLPDLEFHRPKDLESLNGLVSDLKSKDESFKFQAGGTDLIANLKLHNLNLKHLISLNGLSGLKDAQLEDKVLKIGSLMRLGQITRNETILKYLPSLSSTAQMVASSQIRNRATIAGNLLVDHRCIYFNQSETNRNCHDVCFKAGGESCRLVPNATRNSDPICRARFASDIAPVLLLHNARFVVASPKGQRSIDLREFYNPEGLKGNSLKEDEVILSLEIPVPDIDKVLYKKLRIRNTIDFPSLGVAFLMDSSHIRISLTGIDTHPLFIELNKSDLNTTEQMLEECIKLSSSSVTAMRQDFFSPSYRKKMISVFIRDMAEMSEK